MNFSELWPLLFNNGTKAEGEQLKLRVLYGERKQALLVPLDKQQAHHAVDFFINNRLLKYWGHFLISIDHYLPLLNVLPRVKFENFPFHSLFGVNGADDETTLQGIALFCGFPGPLQKLTIYCPGDSGTVGKVAKVAMHTTANDALKKEAHWLEKLGSASGTAQFMPQILQHSTLSCQRYFLTMLSLPDGASPKTFGRKHYEFLRMLAQQQPVFSEWKDSIAHRRLKERIGALSTVVASDIWLYWQALITEIEQLTGRSILPNLMVHGDFAPWNLRQIDANLYVFDWEYAEIYGNPLQDFLHFHLMQQALKRRPLHHKKMSALLAKAVVYVNKQFGRDVGIDKACGALTLHYLLDTITFYVEASGYIDDNHPVMHNYQKMLAQRALWLPTTLAPTTKDRSFQRYDPELEVTQ